MVEQLVINVGRKLRTLRQQRALSLRKLSEKVGVSPSAIQKIERNLISPTLGTVLRIAKGLGTTLPSLFDEQAGPVEAVFLPAKRRRTVRAPDLRIDIQPLADGLPDQPFSAVLLMIPKGAKMKEREFRHHGEELQLCIKGRVNFTIRNETYLLTRGDSLRFKSDVRHYWENVGDTEAQLLMICAPPIHLGGDSDGSSRRDRHLRTTG
jgi:transcriptional regulator with XRE-family HTH domain